MKLAIMQPYFLPYIGYYQLLAAVDVFILYDNIKYTKKGWINRNRLLQNGKDAIFSLPLKSDSDYLNICERELSSTFKRDKLLNQFRGAYHRAPYFAQTFPLVEEIVQYENDNLFEYLRHSIISVCTHLDVKTQIRMSSEIQIDHSLKGQKKVLALCQALGAKTYINAIGGMELYAKADFQSQGIALKFIQSKPHAYTQFDAPFVPWLSIVDVMMFSPAELTRTNVFSGYDLI